MNQTPLAHDRSALEAEVLLRSRLDDLIRIVELLDTCADQIAAGLFGDCLPPAGTGTQTEDAFSKVSSCVLMATSALNTLNTVMNRL